MDERLEYRLTLSRMHHYAGMLFRDVQAGYISFECFVHGLRALWYLDLISDSEYFFWTGSTTYPTPTCLALVCERSQSKVGAA